MDTPRARKLVVAGLVGERGRFLLTQRRADQLHPLAWELPGGKLEPGEAPEVGLARELAEEVGAAVEIGPIWDVLFHAYPTFDVLMLVYPCRLVPGAGAPRALEVADLAWRRPEAAIDLEVLAADVPLLERLRREGLPGFLTLV